MTIKTTTTQTGLFNTAKHFKKAENETGAKHANLIALDGPRIIGTFETVVKFKPQNITQVDVYRPNGRRRVQNENSVANLLGQGENGSAYNGYLSPSTNRNIQQMLAVWLSAIEQNVVLKNQAKKVDENQVLPTFVTLTLPAGQVHRDKDIRESILHPFLKWVQQSSCEYYVRGELSGQQKGFGVKGFFWRAESQENGNMHFHIIVDRFIPWQRIRKEWNSYCEKLGYIDAYKYNMEAFHKDGFRLDRGLYNRDVRVLEKMAEKVKKTGSMPKKIHPVFKSFLEKFVKTGKALEWKLIKAAAIEKQEKAYQDGVACGWSNPNSTDIHAIQNLQSVTAYVIKYVTKKPSEKPLQPNQKVRYSEDFKKNCVYTYENVKNPLTGKVEELEVDLEFYKPEFVERKINGRLWGCADVLRGTKINKEQMVQEDENGYKYVFEEIPVSDVSLTDKSNSEVPRNKMIKRPFIEFKYFNKILAESVVIAPANRNQSPIYSDKQTVCQITMDYLSIITDKIGKITIEAISSLAGPAFHSMEGRIIPLQAEKLGFKAKNAHVSQADVLKKFAPILYKEYLDYHKHIFNCLYGEAA